ncbi:Hypothetical protein CKL_3028 [Clostridium kluyveri DSM 555]|uniref:Uncharacterized protein n=1 Tax=Clostridium kluyveri (strain ATCC 8527 / DSM 555 / NBRC 12016 / NCIMB 10680 / K1) TaxID=431943 RepID=A5N1P0_CLOK5|nr:Hypothetical protein CKL_3028 [Clostridium kluyveri DSM 555]
MQHRYIGHDRYCIVQKFNNFVALMQWSYLENLYILEIRTFFKSGMIIALINVINIFLEGYTHGKNR